MAFLIPMVPRLTNTSSKEFARQCSEVHRIAAAFFDEAPDWVTFFRDILGVNGVVRRCFTSFDEVAKFERTEYYTSIQKMLVKLRERRVDGESEPTRVMTVRIPRSVHEYLRTEAHDLRTSMNKLCLTKLLRSIEQEMIPADVSEASEEQPSRHRFFDKFDEVRTEAKSSDSTNSRSIVPQ